MKIIKFDLKWVHMARYELILRQDEAHIKTIFKTLLTPQKPVRDPTVEIQKPLRGSEGFRYEGFDY